MTEKVLDTLYSDYPDIDFGILKVLKVGCGDPTNLKTYKPYKLKSKPDPMKEMASLTITSDMVRHFRLLANGELVLEKLTYPFHQWAKPDMANEKITGDFWLEMTTTGIKRHKRPVLLVPFYKGVICSDVSRWYLRSRKEGLVQLSDEDSSLFVRQKS